MQRFFILSRLVFCTFLLLGSTSAYSQLVINELSQGSGGSEEFVELVVAGNRSCTDTCVDIRGWIIDDNNGFHGTDGIATGAIRFANIPQWQCVPYGTLILVYNGADKNSRITMPDDSTDANNDHIYILKANSSKLERNRSNPTGSDSSYSKGTFTTPASIAQDWGLVAMANGGDAFQTVDPKNLLKSYFSVGYGTVNKRLNIYFTGSAAGTNFYMAHTVDDDIFKQANWKAGTAGTAEETPGVANNVANAAWLTKLRTNTSGGTTDTAKVFICSGQSYFAGGANRTTTGFYADTFKTQAGCDSIVITNLNVATVTTSSIPLSGCTKVTINGRDFFSNTTYLDTLRNVRGCDSVRRTFTITITQSYRDTVKVCINTGQSYFAGGANRTTSGIYNDTLPGTGGGCDSIRSTDLRVITPTTVPPVTLQDCRSVTYKGKTYTTNTTVKDTTKSVLGCDSIFNTINIIINSGFVSTTTSRVCIAPGESYPAGGGNQTTSGTYRDTLNNVNGCDSIVVTILQVLKLDSAVTNLLGCGSLNVRGIVVTSDTTLSDTLFSKNGCDSLYIIVHIRINQNSTTTKQVCINEGQSYFAGGANQTTSGIYPDLYQSSNGCDSLVNTDLRVMGITKVPVCVIRGQSYFAQGANQTTAGIYTDTLTSVLGCDSVVQTDLQIVDTTSDVLPVQGCGSYTYKGITYTQDATVEDVVLSTRGCDSIYRRLVITILPAPSVEIIRAADSVLLGDSLQLSIQPGNYMSIVWEPASSLSSTTGTSVYAAPRENTKYVVYVTADNGCQASDSFVLNVILPELKYIVPSGFTPNNDGNNDHFYPILTGSGTLQEMRIYNRWGELVYNNTAAPGWDGTFKGAAQPSGVYVYYIIVYDKKNNRPDKQHGSVTLIR